MPSSSDCARRGLVALWESVLQNNQDHHLWSTDEPTASHLSMLNIKWESLVLDNTRDSSLQLIPSVLFHHLSQEILDLHPVQSEPEFFEYAPSTKGAGSLEVPWTPLNCARHVEYYLSGWVSHFPRAGFPKKSRPFSRLRRCQVLLLGRVKTPVYIRGCFSEKLSGAPNGMTKAPITWQALSSRSSHQPARFSRRRRRPAGSGKSGMSAPSHSSRQEFDHLTLSCDLDLWPNLNLSDRALQHKASFLVLIPSESQIL